jgi:hypothetical protein
MKVLGVDDKKKMFWCWMWWWWFFHPHFEQKPKNQNH